MENTKKLKKQLLAAIIMLLVAAVALGTSTYAWFVTQGTVEANGMKVHAQAENGIVIKEKDTENEFNTVATVTDSSKALIPTSTADFTTWYHSSSTKYDDATVDGRVFEPVASNELDDHRLLKTFIIRAAGNTAINDELKITEVKATGGTDQLLNKAIRVGVVVGEHLYIYAPNADNDFELKANYAGGGEGPTIITEKTAPAPDSLGTVNIPASNTGLEVPVYIWYEGEDDNCMSKNITAAEMAGVNVLVKFAITEPVH